MGQQIHRRDLAGDGGIWDVSLFILGRHDVALAFLINSHLVLFRSVIPNVSH